MTRKSCLTCDALHYGPVPAGKGAIGYQCRRHPAKPMLLPMGADLAGNIKMSIVSIWPVIDTAKAGEENPFCFDWIPAEPGKFIGRPDPGLDS